MFAFFGQACTALVDQLLAERPGEIELRPMTKFPVLRDLLVDRGRLFRSLQRVRAWVPVEGMGFWIRSRYELWTGRWAALGTAMLVPLAVDITAMLRLFESDVLAVFHAAQQDLDVLTHAVGAVPAKMFDTQLAAGFVGYGTPSLVSLLQGEVGISPPKGDRLTDWLRRPLSDSQRQYAAVDVEYLLFEDEGHGLEKKENRVRGFRAIREFLDRHLNGSAAG